MENGLRTLKIIWGVLLAAVPLYIYMASIAKVRAVSNPVLMRAIALVALSEVVVVFIFRRMVLAPAVSILTTRPDDQAALAKWRAGNIVSWAMGVSIALYGIVLRYVGFDFRQVIPFFLLGFLLIFFLPPRRPEQLR